jgi:hypothetical protein
MFPRYDCEAGTFDSVQQAATALGKVTVRRDYRPIPKPGQTVQGIWWEHARALQAGECARPTLFLEIDAVPGPQPDWAAEVWGRKPGEIEEGVDDLAARGVAALRDYLTCISSTDLYLMPHSAGYDSRLISLLVGERNNGNVYFMVWQPEVEATQALLEAIGWDPSRVRVIGAGEVDYQAPALDMLALGSYQSEPDRFIVGPSLADLSIGGEFAKWPCITAAFSDETFGYNTARWPNVAYFHAARLLDGPSPWQCSDWIMPFVSEQWLTFLSTYRVANTDNLKRAMVRHISPRIADIANPRYELAEQIAKYGHHQYAKISDETRHRVARAYEASWYAKNVNPVFRCPEAFGSHDGLEQRYIAACICEYLAVEGVEVCAS